MFQRNTCARLFWNPCLNVEVMARTCSIYDHFIIWPWHFIKCDLDLQPTWPTFQMAILFLKENCPKLFWNRCIHVEVLAQTISIYDHFISFYEGKSVTLTFNLPEQRFQMALLLLKENNCTELFWNPCINISYGPDKARWMHTYTMQACTCTQMKLSRSPKRAPQKLD